MHTHTHVDAALGRQFYLWGKGGFVQVWKIKPRYFWQPKTAEHLDHYLEPAAELGVENSGSGGQEDSEVKIYSSLVKNRQERRA